VSRRGGKTGFSLEGREGISGFLGTETGSFSKDRDGNSGFSLDGGGEMSGLDGKLGKSGLTGAISDSFSGLFRDGNSGFSGGGPALRFGKSGFEGAIGGVGLSCGEGLFGGGGLLESS